MYGSDASTSHFNFGVFGSSSHGTGVHGTTSSGPGISAAATGSTGMALTATAPKSPVVVKLTGSGTAIAVTDSLDPDDTTEGTDVETVGSALVVGTGFGYGLEAYGASEGSGIFAYANQGDGIDIGNDDGDDGLPLSITSSGDGPMILGGDGSGNTYFDADSNGNLTITGHLKAKGGVDISTARADGTQVATYSPRDTEPVVEDVGETRVLNGAANVALDPAFAATLDPTRPYYVFLTPEGDNRGLFIGTKTLRGFTIRESSNGRSALAVQYRIVGKPLGPRERRLAAFDTSLPPRTKRLRGRRPQA